jgi:hypothetical protein
LKTSSDANAATKGEKVHDTSAKSLLLIMTIRHGMHVKGKIHPHPSVVDATEQLVKKLAELDPSEPIDIVVLSKNPVHAQYLRAKTGELLAEIKIEEDLDWRKVVTDERSDTSLPEGWYPVTDDVAAVADKELTRELHASHALYRLKAKAIGRRRDSDVWLFQLAAGQIAEIHLTYSLESTPTWPRTRTFQNKEQWRRYVETGEVWTYVCQVDHLRAAMPTFVTVR